MPTLRALECLVAVLDHGSITEAAAHLLMSQPALSHQLAGLERELGGPVVQRLPRGVRATALGRAVAADARASIAAAERLVVTGRAVADGTSGHLRIACAESMTVPVLSPVLRRWRGRHPDVTITLAEVSSADELVTMIDEGACDVSLGPRPSQGDEGGVLIGVEEVVVAMPLDHRLVSEAGVAWSDLGGEAMVGFHRDNGLGGWLDAVAREHDTRLTVTTRTRQAVSAAHLAAAGLGLALVPTSAITGAYPGALRRLEPPLEREVVARVANPSDALAASVLRLLESRGLPMPRSVRAALAPAPAAT